MGLSFAQTTRGIFFHAKMELSIALVSWQGWFHSFFSFGTEIPAGGIGKPVKKRRKTFPNKQGMKTSYYSLVEIKASLLWMALIFPNHLPNQKEIGSKSPSFAPNVSGGGLWWWRAHLSKSTMVPWIFCFDRSFWGTLWSWDFNPMVFHQTKTNRPSRKCVWLNLLLPLQKMEVQLVFLGVMIVFTFRLEFWMVPSICNSSICPAVFLKGKNLWICSCSAKKK